MQNPRGIECARDVQDLVYVPLCHPSMPNRYANDHRSLATAIEATAE